MRKENIVTGEYYHIYNRGVDKRDVFLDLKDVERFKECIIQFNQIHTVGSLRENQNPRDSVPVSDGLVAIIAFTLNPNHFHFILKQLKDGGVAKFMHKLQSGYTSYFNSKNDRSGALFQGPYKTKGIMNENYFRKIFAYVNQNYAVHTIPKNKLDFVFASDREYANQNFIFVDKKEGNEMLKIFGGKDKLQKHCKEIVAIICEERGKPGLDKKEDDL